MKNREIEVKALDIDIKNMILKLKKLGAKKARDTILRRIIFDYPDNSLDKKKSWIRLRTDGKTTTLTYKKIINDKIDGKEEHEIIVDNFESARELLKNIGFEEKRFEESRRIVFSLGKTEIDIDIWPMLPVYMEVETETKQELLNALKKLDIDIKKTHTYSGRELYAHYHIDLEKHKNLKLEKDKKEMKI